MHHNRTALRLPDPPANVVEQMTPEMLAAGIEAFGSYERRDQVEAIVRDVYDAIERVRLLQMASSDS